MEMQSHKITVEPLSLKYFCWFVEVAAVNMLTDELKCPEWVDYDQLYTLANKGMQDGTAWVALRGDIPIGALGALLVPNVFSPKRTMLSETFWYVLPEYHGTRAGALLFNVFNKKGEECANDACMSLLSSSSVKIKTIEKRGYMLKEFSFRKAYEK